MMKCEFEALVKHPVSQQCYDRIEQVYTNCDAIKDKAHIARIYQIHDMLGIETIFQVITGHATTDNMISAAKYIKEAE